MPRALPCWLRAQAPRDGAAPTLAVGLGLPAGRSRRRSPRRLPARLWRIFWSVGSRLMLPALATVLLLPEDGQDQSLAAAWIARRQNRAR